MVLIAKSKGIVAPMVKILSLLRNFVKRVGSPSLSICEFLLLVVALHLALHLPLAQHVLLVWMLSAKVVRRLEDIAIFVNLLVVLVTLIED